MTGPAAPASAVVLVVVAAVLLRGAGPASAAARIGARGAALAPLALLATAFRARATRSSASERHAVAVGELVEAWASGLRAGAPVVTALGSACADVPAAAGLLPLARGAVLVDDDIAAALRRDASALDGPAARAVASAAACAVVAGASGGRLADALDRIGDGLRADRQHVAHVQAQLAAPRATSRLLAVLPVMALVLQEGAGMEPLSVLLDAPIGIALAAVGIGLDVLGLWWTGRIARAAVRPPDKEPVHTEPVRPNSTPSAVVRAAGALGVAVLTDVLVGGTGPWFGPAAALVAGIATWSLLGRLESSGVRRMRERVVADLPSAVELTVSCLAAGATVERALAASGDAVGGPVGRAFDTAGAALALGAAPAEAFDPWCRDTLLAPLEPFARLLRRSLVSGTALVPAASRFATELRLAARWEADATARRVGVRATVPLGVCFLPAFVLLGIVPAVVAGARGLVV